jgi:hypothetical protein
MGGNEEQLARVIPDFCLSPANDPDGKWVSFQPPLTGRLSKRRQTHDTSNEVVVLTARALDQRT